MTFLRKIDAPRIKRGPVLIAVLSLFFGLQIAAFAGAYDDGWQIGGHDCPHDDTTAYMECVSAKCKAMYGNSADKCAYYSCYNGGMDWWQNNVTCNEICVHKACPSNSVP